MIDNYLQGARQRFTEFGGFVTMEAAGTGPALADWADDLLVREEQGLVTLVALVMVAPEGALKAVRDELALLADRIAVQHKTEVQAVMLLVTAERLVREQYDRWQGFTLNRGPVRLVPWVVDLSRGAVFEHKGPPFGLDPDLAMLADPRPECAEPADGEAHEGQAFHPQAPARPWVTIGLMTTLVLIWMVMTVAGGSLSATEDTVLLFDWGAQARPQLWLSGQYWRLLTAAFLHFGAIHLVMNGLGLWVVGRVVETLYGPWRMLLIYLVAAVGGSVLSAMAGPPMAVAAGASGAVFGLLGAVVWFRLSSPLGYRIAWRPVLTILGVNLAVGLALSSFIDNWNHLGGLVGGFVAAAAAGVPAITGLDRPRYSPGRWGHVAAAMVLVVGSGAVLAGLVDLPGPGRDLARAGEAYEDGRLQEAEAGFRQAVARQEDQPQLHWALALTYYRQGKCREARLELNELRALDPEHEGIPELHELLQRCGS